MAVPSLDRSRLQFSTLKGKVFVSIRGSGPPRRPVSRVSIDATSALVSWKSKTAQSSAILVGRTDLGMSQRPH